MCSRYEAPTRDLLRTRYPGAAIDQDWERVGIWPGYVGPFMRRPAAVDAGDDAVPSIEVLPGNFGLIPFWAKDDSLAKRTYNARSETVAEKPSFRDAWAKAQHCIIPATAIYEPDWRSGKAIPTRITRADGDLLGIAGLWESRRRPDGTKQYSYTMLTINADDHKIFRELHRPDPRREPHLQDKRMVVVLPRRIYSDWLDAGPERSMEFMQPFPAGRLAMIAEPATSKPG